MSRAESPRGSRYDEPSGYGRNSSQYSSSRRQSAYEPDRFEVRTPSYAPIRRRPVPHRPTANEFTGTGCTIGRSPAVRRDENPRYGRYDAGESTYGGEVSGRHRERNDRPNFRWPLTDDTGSTQSSRRGTESSYGVYRNNSARSVYEVPSRRPEYHSSASRYRPGTSMSAVREFAGLGEYGSYRGSDTYDREYELPRRSSTRRSSSRRYRD